MRQLKIAKQVTNRETASLDKYLQEIGRVDLITADEEVQLARKIRDGDRQALERLTKANLRFVVSVSKQYQNQGLALPDLINEGNVGLIKAAERFDETRGFKFISYAVWWIRQAILQTLADQGRTVRLPTSRMNRIVQIKRLAGRLEQEWGREVHSVELAEQLGLSPEEVDAHLAWALRPTSQDAPSGNGDDESTWSERLEDMNRLHQPGWVLERESLAQDVDDVLGGLSNREAEILRFSFGIGGRPQLETDVVSNRFQLSRERIRQIRERALRRLRGMAQTTRLRVFLGGT